MTSGCSPRQFDLSEYTAPAARTRATRAITPAVVDAVKKERADCAHQDLTVLLAAKVRACGAVPRSNNLVDLAANIGGERFIFEVKSTTETNSRAQIRKGVSQLYEYRYLQSAPDAKLVLVIENPLPSSLGWMAEYLITDRNLALLWDGDRRSFNCDPRQQDLLGMLL